MLYSVELSQFMYSCCVVIAEMLWKPPEFIRKSNENHTKEGDIYAVGIIMQEVAIRGPPFENEFRETEGVEGD